MAIRRKIGLIYQYNENWIGGTYYIENLIAALNHLRDQQKPEIFIFTDDENSFQRLISKTGYPYISNRPYFRKLHLIERVINLPHRIIFKKNIFLPYYADLDVVFPGKNEHRFIKGQQFIYWIPDFQEYYLPEFFSEEELIGRKKWHQAILDNAKYILFSSNTVKKHFDHIYPDRHLSHFVVKFAVTHPDLDSDLKLADYQIPANFFICSNQFWKHKNHIVILKAIQLLKQRGEEIFVVFTGKEHDNRHPDYFKELTETVEALSITDNIKFLGFVERGIQLQLMKKAIAVIQPSLFEGWSTVVEDAKATGVQVISSDIDVHKEQLMDYPAKTFFKANDEVQLSEILIKMKYARDENFEYDYNKNIGQFAQAFYSALTIVTEKPEA